MSNSEFLKYFEVTIGKAREWGFRDWILFVIESLYSTVFPFIAGMLFVKRQELVWIMMLILPIYFRLQLSKKETPKTRKIYVK